MNHAQIDLEDLMSFDAKMEILKEIKQEGAMDAFKKFKTAYKPITKKKAPLDQLIAVGISATEKNILQREIEAIKKAGTPTTVSAFVRSRAVGTIDIHEWKEYAIKGLRDLSLPKWDKNQVKKDLNRTMVKLENLEDGDSEGEFIYRKQIKEYQSVLEEIDRPTERRGFRLSGRVTFNEANHIRWRAAKLNITVTDYMRFLIFGHKPFSEFDRHLSIDARKRFYISILDVAANGWGETPHIIDCENCARYAAENEALKQKLERIQK